MKKPSKLLSLFLAAVMVLTSLSAGFTALAAEWNNRSTVNGKDVTAQVDAIAHALWGANGDDGTYSSITKWDGSYEITTDNRTGKDLDGDGEPDDWNGNRLHDNADGDMYTAVKNAWEIVMNAQAIVGATSGTNKKTADAIKNVLVPAISNYMGADFSKLGVSATLPNIGTGNNSNIWYSWFGLGGGYEGTNGNGEKKSYNVYILLDPEYYAWNQFKDENGNVDLEAIPNQITSEHTFYWQSGGNSGGTRSTSYYEYVGSVPDPMDQESNAVLVNINEIKAFNALFAEEEENYWDAFVAHEFDSIPDAVQTAILNGAIDTYKDIITVDSETVWNTTRGGGGIGVIVKTDHEATQIIFENCFETNEEELFGAGFADGGFDNGDIAEDSHYYAFLRYLVQKFIDAVDSIEENYFASGSIESDLNLEELTELKREISLAYNIWNGLPESLQPMAETEKGKLDSFYYNDTDTAENITSFVPAWNTANAQAYIDAVEELEFASGYVDGVEVEEYVIKSKAEADKVKALLDAADAAYGNLLWEASYEETAEKVGTPGFNDITVMSEGLAYVSPENGYTVEDGITVFQYANKVYRGAFIAYYEYLYRQFMEIAPKNLDEYVQDSNGNGEIDLTDQIVIPSFTILDVVPVRAKINRVRAAYNPLVQEFRDREWVIFYMNVVEALEKALNNIPGGNGAWERYDVLKYPYYYNWNIKDQDTTINNIAGENQVADLLAGLNALVGSKQIASLIGADSIADFANDAIANLLTGDSANEIIKTVLTLVMPLIQDAMTDARVDVDVTLLGSVHDTIMNIVRNNGNLGLAGLSIVVMYPDPSMLDDKISTFAKDPDSIDAAKKIAEAGTDWDAVDWEHVDWKIKTVDEFCNVMGAILERIAKLVRSLLFNEKAEADLNGSLSGLASAFANVDLTISQWYNAGYEKDILPFLELLGCEGVQSSSTLTDWADNNKWADVVKAIVNPLLNRVESLLSGDIVTNILGLLPNLAYLLLWDKIAGTSPVTTKEGYGDGGPGWIAHPKDKMKTAYEGDTGYAGVRDLLAPLSKMAGLTLEGFGINALDGSFIMDTINGLLADTGFVLPDINWAMIAGMGTMDENASSVRNGGKRKNIIANPEEIIIFFINYVAEVLYSNKDALYDMISGMLPEGDENVAEMFEQFFNHLMATASDPQAFGAVIFELLRGVGYEKFDWTDIANWDWENTVLTDADYAATDYTKDDVTKSIDILTTIVQNALALLLKNDEGDSVSLPEYLDEKVFKGDIINTLFKSIYSLDSEMIRLVLSFIEVTGADGETNGIDISLENVIEILTNAGYDDVAAKLEAWAENYDYFVAERETGDYAINCSNCGTQIKVDEAADGSTTCTNDECGAPVEYSADDVYAITEKISAFDDDNITADMWNVTDAESFKNALVTILDPFKYLVGDLLAGANSSASIAKVLEISGNAGYENAIKPILAVFGAGLLENSKGETTLLVSEDDFNAAPENALANILDMVFDLIDAYGADPFGAILNVAPQVASFIHNNGIQNLITYVIQPLWNILSAPLDLFQINNDIVPEGKPNADGKTNHNFYANEAGSPNTIFNVLLDVIFSEENSPLRDQITWENLDDQLIPIINEYVLKDIIKIYETDENGDALLDEEGNKIVKKSFSLEIPNINWKDLGGSGIQQDQAIVADKESVVVKVLRYVWRIVLTNETAINGLLEEKVGNVFATLEKHGIDLFSYTEDDFVYLVLTIINGLDSSDYDSTDIWDEILNKIYEPTTDVVYPVDENGNTYTYEDVDRLIKFFSGVALGVVEEFITGFDFSELGSTIYSSAVPAFIAGTLLPLLEAQSDIFQLFDIVFTYDDLLAALAAYPAVVAAIEVQGVETLGDIDWTEIAEDDLFAVNGNSDKFADALAAVLTPVAPLINFLFSAGEINVLGVVPLIGSYGYQNALLPLFKTLGIDKFGALDADAFNADEANVLVNIIKPLFAWINNAVWLSEDADGPAGTLLSAIPDLAKFLDNGGLQQFIHDLLYPAVHLINTVIEILTHAEKSRDTALDLVFDFAIAMLSDDDTETSFLDKILDAIFGEKTDNGFTWSNVHEHIFDLAALVINKLIDGATAEVDKDGNLVLNISVSGNPMTIVIPKYNLARLAGIDSSNETKKATDTLLVIWQYLWDGILNNKTTFASVKSLLSNELGDAYTIEAAGATLGTYIERFLSSEANEIVAALIQTTEAVDASDYDSIADWKELLAKTFSPTVAEYPKNGYNSSDINFVIETVSQILTKALDEFANIQLADIANGYLYQDSVVNAVAKIVLNLGTTGIADVLGIIEMDLSKDGIADKLESLGYAAVAKVIRSAASVDDIDWNSITWNANSAEGFAKALAAAISPLDTILGYLLMAGEISINGNEVLTIIGANGYDNAVKHLLEEAFGCTGLKASSEYASVTELIAASLNAVFAKIDSILASGNVVGSVLDAIPQLSAFIARGGIQQFVEDILYPITNFIHPILSLVYDGEVFDFALGLLKSFGVIDFDLKWDTLQDNLIDVINSFLNFTLKGKDITITLNKNLTWAKLAGCATRPDTLLTILSYIWENVQGNKSAIETALKALLGDDTYSNIKQYVNRFLKNADSDIVAAVVQVFRGFDASAHKADWSFLFKNFKQTNVNYPKGVTSDDIEEVIEILTVAIENALEIFLDTTLPTLAGDIIYTDSIINSVKKIVNSLAENDTVKAVFGMLGLEINVNNNTYKVTDKASFAAALADVLKPFEPILNAFLNKGDITIADVITLTGADGFNNAVKPLLEYALGCTNVNDRSLKGIITAVLNRVEEILADPVVELIDLVPMITNFIGKGGVQYFVEELLYPVINIADAIISLITDDSLFDFAFNILGIDIKWSNAHNELIPLANSMLKNVTINGKSYSITIPAIDWLKLGGCGKLSGTTIIANHGDVIMTIFRYLFKALEANKGILYDLVGKDSTIGQIITNILKEGADGFVKIIVTVLLKMETFDNVSWLFKKIKPVETTYTPNYGEEDYARFVQDIDEAIFGLLGSFTDLNVGALLRDKVYKNSIVNTVAKLVYTNLEKITVAGISIHQILRALDLDITTATVADMLKDFSAASAEIGKHGAWSEVNFDAITWNFEDGDKTGFVNALSAALRPIQPLLRVILSGEDLIVLGSIHIKGGNGYNTTVIPLLEAIGIDAENLVTATQYSKEADTDKVLTSILNPVLDFAETLLNKPILTLCNMLPNVAYFLINGGAQAIVENIAGPVFNLLEEIAPIYNLDVDKLLKDAIGFGISDLGDLDLDGLVNTLLASIKVNGQNLTIRITDIDLETLAGRGTLVEYTSARTYNGVRMECKKIVADAPAVFVSVLRYIIENLKANLDAIKELLAGLGLSGDIADMVEMILGFLTDLDTDMVIEQLMELLFGGPDGNTENNGKTPYEVRDMGWLHWTLVACATLFMLLIFLALLSKKKKEDESEPVEVAAQE